MASCPTPVPQAQSTIRETCSGETLPRASETHCTRHPFHNPSTRNTLLADSEPAGWDPPPTEQTCQPRLRQNLLSSPRSDRNPARACHRMQGPTTSATSLLKTNRGTTARDGDPFSSKWPRQSRNCLAGRWKSGFPTETHPPGRKQRETSGLHRRVVDPPRHRQSALSFRDSRWVVYTDW